MANTKRTLITWQLLKIFCVVTSSGSVACHRCMAYPQVTDRGDRLQVRRVAANILNKQCGQPTVGDPTAWRLGGCLKIPP
jgi:hypothetical protein